MPPVLNLRGVGSSWGIRLAIMAGRVLPPGGVEHTRLVWQHCDAHTAADPCDAKGPILICGRCWDDRKVFAGLTIIGPLTASTGVVCDTDDGCGGRDSEVQGDTGTPTGYTEAMGRIAEWNATIERRIERRKQCDTPFGWLPLWHPGAW
jgi:hypothetical protein